MRHSKAMIVVLAALMAAASVSVLARGDSRGPGRGSHAYSGKPGHVVGRFNPATHAGPAVSAGRASPGSLGGHGYSGVRPHTGYVAPHRHFAGVARVGVVIAAPLYAPLYYPAPSYYYSPPPAYIEQAPTPAYWYFCPELNAYYPYVQECPGGWQPVLPPG